MGDRHPAHQPARFDGIPETGKSAKYDSEKIIGRWEFNPAVTIAWLRQSSPKIPASEMRWSAPGWTQAYAQTRVLVTGDNQIFHQEPAEILKVNAARPTCPRPEMLERRLERQRRRATTCI